MEEKDKKSEVNITNNFYAPIGQKIDHVDTINFRMDGDGTFHFGEVGSVEKQQGVLDRERLARAIENSQDCFWANSSYAVLYCICRDDFGKDMAQTAFESFVQNLPYKKKLDYICTSGTIANAMINNNFYRSRVDKWEKMCVPSRVLKLLEKLRKELGVM